MRKRVLASPVLVVLVTMSAGGAMAQGEASPDGLITEEVEPGVERIIRDDVGHDLDERHPAYRYDMDDVSAVGNDGSDRGGLYHIVPARRRATPRRQEVAA